MGHSPSPVVPSATAAAVSFQLQNQLLFVCLGKIGPDMTPHLNMTSLSPRALHPLQTSSCFLPLDRQPAATSPDAELSGFLSPSVPWHSPRRGAGVGNQTMGGCGRPCWFVINDEREADVESRNIGLSNV